MTQICEECGKEYTPDEVEKILYEEAHTKVEETEDVGKISKPCCPDCGGEIHGKIRSPKERR